MKIFSLRVSTFSLLCFIILFSDQILSDHFSTWVAPYLSVGVGFLIAGLYKLWEG